MNTNYQLSHKQSQELKTIIAASDNYTAKEVLRAQVVLLLSQEVPSATIMLITGYQRRQLFNIRKNYFAQGVAGILDKRKGSPPLLLNGPQREELQDILLQTIPRDFGYSQEFWTTAILADFIEARYGVRYASKTSYYVLFKASRFTYHKPGRVYEGRDEKAVKAWKAAIKKRIQKIWGDKQAVILAEDEMKLSTQTTTQKIWLQQGDYPQIEVATAREQRSIYGFLNIKTGQEHAFKQLRQNSEMTIHCLKEIRKCYKGKSLLLLWDNAAWHRAAAVIRFIEQDKRIDIFPFPAYSPEENPQEHVWKTGRSVVSHNRFIDDIDAATDDFVNYLNQQKFKYKLLEYRAIS